MGIASAGAEIPQRHRRSLCRWQRIAPESSNSFTQPLLIRQLAAPATLQCGSYGGRNAAAALTNIRLGKKREDLNPPVAGLTARQPPGMQAGSGASTVTAAAGHGPGPDEEQCRSFGPWAVASCQLDWGGTCQYSSFFRASSECCARSRAGNGAGCVPSPKPRCPPSRIIAHSAAGSDQPFHLQIKVLVLGISIRDLFVTVDRHSVPPPPAEIPNV